MLSDWFLAPALVLAGLVSLGRAWQAYRRLGSEQLGWVLIAGWLWSAAAAFVAAAFVLVCYLAGGLRGLAMTYANIPALAIVLAASVLRDRVGRRGASWWGQQRSGSLDHGEDGAGNPVSAEAPDRPPEA